MPPSDAGPAAAGAGGRGPEPRAPVASVGHIRIVDTLGAGGMGEVYVGWDETLERRVALKAIRREHRMRPEVQGRFLREARVLSQLDHPNICRIFDFVEGRDRDFLVLELIEGENLAAAIRRGLEGARRLAIAEQVADALAAAHAKGVVHRDLKPQNVMLAGSGEAKVLDFGIARSVTVPGEAAGAGEPGPEASPEAPTAEQASASGPPELEATELQVPAGGWSRGEPGDAADRTPMMAAGGGGGAASWTLRGSVLGSPGYLSPEQARGEETTTASDMYAFGLLLQELFTGERPHPAGLAVDDLLRRARNAETLPLSGVRSDVATLISRLLDPAAAARPTAVEALGRLRWIRDRPRRRLIRGVAAALLLVAVLGGLKYTWDLKAARDVAERHRAQADDLIGFMLGDLRDKLAGVGRLELLEDVGDKALDYFDSLPEADRTDEELFRRSQALRQIGEVRIAQGDLPAAMEAFDDSGHLAEVLVGRDPGRGEWLLGLGHSHFWKGNVHWLQGDLAAARQRFERYRELTDRLVASEPEETEWRIEQGYAVTNLAAVHEALGETEAAVAALRRSLVIKEDLLRSDPANLEWRRSLANGLSWQGSMLIARGDLAAAEESFLREREIRRGLLADAPENADAQLLLALNWNHSGNLAAMRGDLVAGRAALEQARVLYRSLVDHDPENSDWQRDLAVAHLELAEILSIAGEPAAARRSLAAGEKILVGLVAQDPSNGDWRVELARARMLASAAALATGDARDAAAAADEAREALEGLAAEKPGQVTVLRNLAGSHLALGEALAASGDGGAAAASWRRAIEILDTGIADSRRLEVLALRATLLLRLERLAEAGELVRQLVAAGYARPDLTRLAARHDLVTSGAEGESP